MTRVRGAASGLAIAVLWMWAPAAFPAEYRLLRYEDDFDAQRNACVADAAWCPKAMPVGDGASLSLGGQARWRYEYTRNPGYGGETQDPRGVLLQRYGAFANLQVGGQWRVFGELASAWASGRALGPTPVDANRLDLANGFVEWRTQPVPERVSAGLRVGVQEVRLGSGRLVDVRDGPNVRRTFTGARAHVRTAAWAVDAFHLRPRTARPGMWDDAAASGQRLRGIQLRGSHSVGQAELYLLDYRHPRAVYVQGTAAERRWTVGGRHAGAAGRWDWNWEAAVQGGRFGAARIRAWTWATETGLQFPAHAWRPRLALLAAAASGDGDAGDARLGTFNPMFPRGNHFGEDATLGPRNFGNVQALLDLRPAPGVQVTAGYSVFHRRSRADGVYSPSGGLSRAPGGSRARPVATVASVAVTWTPHPQWTTSWVAARLRPDAFLRDTGPHAALTYLEWTWDYRF